MKKHMAIFIAAVAALAAHAGDVTVDRVHYGSGQPSLNGVENVTVVENNVMHSPQYLPGFPTAATIWPRVVEVPCTAKGNGLQCDGYRWTPSLGRAEYLYVVPKVVEQPKPITITERVEVPVIVYKEVPEKKGKQ